MEGAVTYGVLAVVLFRWLLASHHGTLPAQQINSLLFTRLFGFVCSICNMLLFTDCHGN